MKEFAKRLYKSKQWQSIRDNVIKRDHYLCQDCLQKGLYIPADEVHHVIPVTPDNIDDPSITLNESNLISLCKNCHKSRHKHRIKRYEIDENGTVYIPL